MSVVTRFAPSPTGFLHIGGVRTALFNWLYARHNNGKYLLRIEDTDRKRSTQEAIDAITSGLEWLGLDADEPPTFQSANLDRHSEVAIDLLNSGKAYHCYCSADELAAMREKARSSGSTRLYEGTWRDKDPEDAPSNVKPVVRFKAPLEGETVVNDLVQGSVTVSNAQLDDMILLRADGTPTYMLSVVVDDHDMGVTHAIRGDDHLTNAFRQTQLFNAIGWCPPAYAHIPLIHGSDGAKLSKRHGALGIEAYREMGYLPGALLNYLLRLGWSHGDEEIISLSQAIEWFDIIDVGRGAARIDFDKLSSVNAHYLHETANEKLADLIRGQIAERTGVIFDASLNERLLHALPGLKPRAKTIDELVDISLFYFYDRPLEIDSRAQKSLDEEACKRLGRLFPSLANLENWSEESIDQTVRKFVETEDIKLGKIAQPLRAALTGTNISPGIFEVAAVLGKTESLGRLDDVMIK
ncbi:MAG: glutamate--tRNA ligase [Rhodospirillaceae bacterium]|nr:glutamate--tRNA ligase [Rhodospirillaceae bacterium]|tara:strand:- start:9447 stop:10850 length:1404 start_codon:yes stop_codon:yes gene_type:complete